MSDTLSQTSEGRRGFKIPMPVFMAFIALLAMVAGWYVYKRVFDVAPVDLRQYDIGGGGGQTRTRMFPRTNQPTAPNAGVGVIRRDTGFDVQSPGVRARYTINPQNRNMRVSLRLMNDSLFPQADRNATSARWTVLNNRDAARNVQVTDAQIEQLRKLVVPHEIALTDDQRKSLIDLAERYQAAEDAKKPAIETELTTLVRTIGESTASATVAAYSKSAGEIRQVLSETQIDRLRVRR